MALPKPAGLDQDWADYLNLLLTSNDGQRGSAPKTPLQSQAVGIHPGYGAKTRQFPSPQTHGPPMLQYPSQTRPQQMYEQPHMIQPTPYSQGSPSRWPAGASGSSTLHPDAYGFSGPGSRTVLPAQAPGGGGGGGGGGRFGQSPRNQYGYGPGQGGGFPPTEPQPMGGASSSGSSERQMHAERGYDIHTGATASGSSQRSGWSERGPLDATAESLPRNHGGGNRKLPPAVLALTPANIIVPETTKKTRREIRREKINARLGPRTPDQAKFDALYHGILLKHKWKCTNLALYIGVLIIPGKQCDALTIWMAWEYHETEKNECHPRTDKDGNPNIVPVQGSLVVCYVWIFPRAYLTKEEEEYLKAELDRQHVQRRIAV